MERPKQRVESVKREVTGEILYLDSARKHGDRPKEYPDDVSKIAVDLYENRARLMRAQGARPEIMGLYEQYDERSDLSSSCASLAEELLKLKRPGSTWTLENIVVETPAAAVLESLQNLRAGKVLAADDDQLAIPSNGEHYPMLDIKKKDATLTGVAARVWGWSDRKQLVTSEPGEPYSYPRDCLMYPSDERSKRYELDIAFAYNHPEAGYFNEKVSLSIGPDGGLRISSQMWVSAYGEMGYEGHYGHSLDDATDADIAAFADLFAQVVGDEPEAVWHYDERIASAYMESITQQETQAYLEEWIDNTSIMQVYRALIASRYKGQSLKEALDDSTTSHGARISIIEMVDKARADYKEAIAAGTPFEIEFLKYTPWRDHIKREA